MKVESLIRNKILLTLEQISQAKKQNNIEHEVRLVAVSKTKPAEDIMEAYNAGIRHFGENYAEELNNKAQLLPLDIQWHFIGHLQSNKIKQILFPNLFVIETIDRISLAQKINNILEKEQKIVNIFIQVCTSNEETKSGVSAAEFFNLYEFILKECPFLKFKGLMTIGKEGDLNAFILLKQLKTELCAKYYLHEEDIELSMGMSNDFQIAISYGASNVRVGSSIFGVRDYNKK